MAYHSEGDTVAPTHTTWILATALAAGLLVSGGRAAAQGVIDDQWAGEAQQISALTTGFDAQFDRPAVVFGAADAARYERIFSLQESGRWVDADKVITQLSDRLLMGQVLAQRYLHSDYRTKYAELSYWLASYSDHPQARRLHALAMRRKPAKVAAPPAPVRPDGSSYGPINYGPADIRPPAHAGLSNKQRADAHQVQREFKSLLRGGGTMAARTLLESTRAQRVLSKGEIAFNEARIARAYFSEGDDRLALDWALKAKKRSAEYAPDAHWIAGLASWRMGKTDQARIHFTAGSERRDISPWSISANAYWAARASLTGGRPAAFNRLLGVAAAYPRTFYGLLARYTLGIPVTFQWESPEAKARQLAELASVPAGRRSIALVQIGALAEAEDEMRALAGSGTANGLTRSIMALADQSGLAALSIRLASVLFAGSGLDGALYPVPQWQPKGGFRVDRALIYALIRKESLFDPNAKSWAGARGLMQLMPGTAAFVANDKAYANTKRDKLLEPEHNLELGQTYIEILLADPSIKGDLFQLVAAWNGGPGNLQRWWRKSNHMNDPLLFIESLPAPETRAFIEQVLANYWIYRSRLGQDAPSLAALAEGRWPEYVSRDPIIQQVAENKP
ncbi:MAG: lytic transglycosylase domain-containing protein [Proteobacteria bacterium]|nr:lytic transglycosylase domain-containing protein [Pseudomonadota bacterium]